MDKEIADLNGQLDAVAESQGVLVDLHVETVRFLQMFQDEQRMAFASLLGGDVSGQAAATAPPVSQAPAALPARPADITGPVAPVEHTWHHQPPVPVVAQPSAALDIDIVVPVYNSLHHARQCIESVLRHVTGPFTLTIVNDCSDSHTRGELDRMVAGFAEHVRANIRLIHHETNAGYLSSVNEAISATRSQICLLLNSDAMLSPGACERLRAGFASDDRIGVITAVSTWANWTKIPFPAGANYLDLQDYVPNADAGSIADIGNASGFFFAVRRSLFSELGLFDKAYNPGYWEEADFCMLAMKAGYRVTVDLQLYIYHHGWGSFQQSGRDEHMARNRHVFMARWQGPYAELERRWRNGNPVMPLVANLAGASRHRKSGQPRVLFISAKADASDDSVALMQLVNGLISCGISANIFYAGAIDERLFDMTPMYFRPLVGRPQVEDLTSYDIYVATSQATAVAANKLAAASKNAAVFGFAFDTSERLSDMRAILRGAGNGAAATDIVALPGVNLDIFYPRDGGRSTHILSRITDAAWAKHAAAIVVFHEKLAAAYPHIDVAIIGPMEIQSRLPSIRHHGEPHRMTQRADILSQALMVVDWDGVEGGRMAFLEAAACGAVPIILADLAEGETSIEMEHCIMASRRDAEALANRLAALAIEPEEIRAFAGKARDLAFANGLEAESGTVAAAFRQAVKPIEMPASDLDRLDALLTLRAS